MAGLTTSQVDFSNVVGGENVNNKVAFSVHRNGVNFNLANGVPTKIAFTTKEYDQDSSFSTANSRFSPKPGKYMLMGATATQQPGIDQGTCLVMVYKNGAQYKSGQFANVSGAGNNCGSYVGCMVIADPGDYYELWAVQIGGAPQVMDGLATDTWFQGYQIG